MNSRLSAGERYEQSERAANGEIDIMIGPRSALFTPFPDLGLIIIDEEHEGAYKSETAPRYDAREVAKVRADMSRAAVVLGSATPSVESYYLAEQGEYKLLTLKKRAKENSRLAGVHIVDLREELAEGNRSIFSRRLKGLIEDRLANRQQVMLFMNRRGYAGFVSCRSCGKAMKCPHCDVSLTYHKNGRLKCHYCGFERPLPDRCPSCGSPFIAPFGTGTQKLEEFTKREFPKARILRMDADTTAKKGAHEEILATFAEGGADILIGTQMIVKGHDFANVTLVGVMAADLSLYAPDYKSAERTFELLTQASGGRARGASGRCGDPDICAGPLCSILRGRAGLSAVLPAGASVPEDDGISAPCKTFDHRTFLKAGGGCDPCVRGYETGHSEGICTGWTEGHRSGGGFPLQT